MKPDTVFEVIRLALFGAFIILMAIAGGHSKQRD